MNIKVGTRSSNLALAQTKLVTGALEQIGVNCEIKNYSTPGDENQKKPLFTFKKQGVFTSNLNGAILKDEVDCAVHSCKDLPSKIESELTLAAVLPRGDARDCIIGKNELIELNSHSEKEITIATGSIRRQAQWLYTNPNHNFVEVRGNIETRLKKLKENKWDALLMAATALERLNIKPEFVSYLESVPAPCQGIIVIVTRKQNRKLVEQLSKINHRPTYYEMLTERTVLKELNAGCSQAIACRAKWIDDTIHLKAEMFNNDLTEKIIAEEKHDAKHFYIIAKKVADKLAPLMM